MSIIKIATEKIHSIGSRLASSNSFLGSNPSVCGYAINTRMFR